MKEESISLLRCKSALLNLPCSYGDACRFVHDDAELTRRQDLLREKRAQKARLARGICYKFSTDAACIYGDSCRFAHVEADIASAYVAKVGKRRERLQQRRAEYEAHSATDASSRVNGENRLELEMRACPLYGDHKQLFEEAIHVMSRWRERFHDRPDIWMRFTKRTEQQTSRLVKEFCEAAPVIARVRACVRAIEPKEPPVTIVDLCSGFGFISMFLSEMLPASRVHRILLIDKRWSFTALQRDMHSGETVSVGEGEGEAAEDVDGRASANYISVDHITGSFYDSWPIPLVASKQNLKSASCLRSMQRAVLDRALREGDLILLGVHLCGLLSLRAVSIFNNNSDRVRLLALKPCCLPGLVHAQRKEVFVVGKHQFPACLVCAAGKYETRSNTKERWNGPPRNHLEAKFLLWTENLAMGIDLSATKDSISENKGRKIWKKHVEHVALQPVGYQNKYIWAEVQQSADACKLDLPSEVCLAADTVRRVGSSLPREMKLCGHHCCPSSVSRCCACSDLRPVLDGDLYPSYMDGVGWANVESRDAGYCPVCNPKNYEAWIRRLELEHIQKLAAAQVSAEQQARQLQKEEDDRRRAAAAFGGDGKVVEFTYSNGDVYNGLMVGGDRCGWGRLAYADGAVYEGHWREDMHDGFGTKDWCDGIVYTGEWKCGEMHGKGKYSMADGTELEGIFENDEFAGYE